ncbi:MAG: DUF58 domain-containing protein [Candidatus Scalindua sp. AMX11]|nr:MAG: DUF58 domain-containing protein [Candidatus Scalindua sp.]RZV91405.1 MAG: DUF58 domain-containing protein [Candidatus Scalindua sp. SCAELEC01]TDE65962.1 MAG: DUF58 domain-containing protein [Candidatus Scalindua sp. AMX11]
MRRRIRFHMQKLVSNLFEGVFYSYVRTTRGVELDELRQYQPGDEFRSIDWKTTTRTGLLHVRLKLVDRRTCIFFLVDKSGSKKFGSSRFTKRDIQTSLLYLLVKSATEAGNQVSFITFTDRVERYVPPQSGQKENLKVVESLNNDKTRGGFTDLNCAFEFLNTLHTTTSLVFVLSDFLAPFNYESSFKLLVGKHDIVPIIISDIREETLPKARGFMAVRDLESDELMYLDLSQGLVSNQQNRDLFHRLNLEYLTLRTDEDEDQWARLLLNFFDNKLRRRSRLKR